MDLEGVDETGELPYSYGDKRMSPAWFKFLVKPVR